MIGVVADDITGANDIGLMFAKHGYQVEVFSNYRNLNLKSIPADVLILDTNSRCDTAADAYKKVFEATRRLISLNCTLIMKKTCSVFRGNIGAEFDAALDAANADFAVVIAAFPKNGRVTKNGRHFVHGRLLSESEFADDPIHPMAINDLRDIIALQSKRPTHLLDHDTIAKGAAFIQKKAGEAKRQKGYLVCDAISQENLKDLAQAFFTERFIFGSSAIAEELPLFWPPPAIGTASLQLPGHRTGTLIVAGSLTNETRNQVAFAVANQITAVVLDTSALFSPDTRQREVRRVVELLVPVLAGGKPALIHSPQQWPEVEETYKAASQAGFSKISAHRMVSKTLGEISRWILEKTGYQSLIVAGGETSNDVCDSLGIIGNLVLKEIEPGLPSGLSRGSHELLIVLKSGSFGSPDFFLKALNHLNQLTPE
jgi:uncharacterized protein YgbK (DUF1537 family)